jgi:hypothetical protein
MLATPTGEGGVVRVLPVQQLCGFGRAFQPHVHPLQQVGLVEDRLDDVDLVGVPGRVRLLCGATDWMGRLSAS